MSEPNSGLGRRGEALDAAKRLRSVVKVGEKQNRHVRRNNLRLAREAAKKAHDV